MTFAAARGLNAKLRELFTELGREVSEAEVFELLTRPAQQA